MSRRNENPENCGVMSKGIPQQFIDSANSKGKKREKEKRGLQTRPDTVRRGGQLAMVSGLSKSQEIIRPAQTIAKTHTAEKDMNKQ